MCRLDGSSRKVELVGRSAGAKMGGGMRRGNAYRVVRWVVVTDGVLDGAVIVLRVWQAVSIRLGYSQDGGKVLFS